MTDELDPGAYIGHEPELEEESIPGGVRPGEERVAAYDSEPGVKGEPDSRPDNQSDSSNGVDLDPLSGVETKATR